MTGDRKPARRLRGDLDTIIDKALRKEPAQRYSSVESMAADLRRHLAGDPVWAQPPSWRYRTAKFVGRHRVALTALVSGDGVARRRPGRCAVAGARGAAARCGCSRGCR